MLSSAQPSTLWHATSPCIFDLLLRCWVWSAANGRSPLSQWISGAKSIYCHNGALYQKTLPHRVNTQKYVKSNSKFIKLKKIKCLMLAKSDWGEQWKKQGAVDTSPNLSNWLLNIVLPSCAQRLKVWRGSGSSWLVCNYTGSTGWANNISLVTTRRQTQFVIIGTSRISRPEVSLMLERLFCYILDRCFPT